MSMSASRILPRAIAAAALCGSGHVLHAAELDWTVRLGLAHNDNVSFSTATPVAEDIFVPGIDFLVRQDGARVRANLIGSLEYRNYLGGHYKDTVRGQLGGQLDWIVLPERLSWSFQDSLMVQPINEFAADTPDNQQQTNVFATGPSLVFGRGRALDGRVDLRYIESHAQRSRQFDTRRMAGAFSIGRDVTSVSRITANLDAQKVRFLSTPFDGDFTRYDAYAEYTRTLNHFDFDIAAGYSRLSFTNPAFERSGGPLLRTNLGWRPDARNTLNLALARQYTDAADAMLRGGSAGVELPTGVNTGDASVTAQAYLAHSADLSYAWQSERSGWTFGSYWHKFDYPTSDTFDRTTRGFRAGFGYSLRPRLLLGLSATTDRTHYLNMDRTDRNRNYSASLGYQWTRRLAWNLSYTHQARRSPAFGQNGNQNVIYFQFIVRR